MKIGIEYWQRLGDVIRLFPLAKHFSDQGHEVEIMCSPIYHDIFKCIDYATPVIQLNSCDVVHKLEVWDSFNSNTNQMRYADFRMSKKKWVNFIYDDFKDVDHSNIQFTNIEFDDFEYDLPSEYNMIAPCGQSQVFRWDSNEFMKRVSEVHQSVENTLPSVFLGDCQKGFLQAKKINHLPKLIKEAHDFFCINSAPSIIAGAVREKHYYHFCEPSFDFQDDYDHELQLKIKPTLEKL